MTPPDRKDHWGAGFTLIEILVTLAILAVVTGAAAMAIGGGQSRDLDAAFRRLNTRLQYASDDALMATRELALIADPKTGYRFVAWNPATGDWSGDPGPALENHDTGPFLRLSGLEPDGVIRFRPAGESQPFALVVTAGDRLWRIVSDGFTVAPADPNAS